MQNFIYICFFYEKMSLEQLQYIKQKAMYYKWDSQLPVCFSMSYCVLNSPFTRYWWLILQVPLWDKKKVLF